MANIKFKYKSLTFYLFSRREIIHCIVFVIYVILILRDLGKNSLFYSNSYLVSIIFDLLNCLPPSHGLKDVAGTVMICQWVETIDMLRMI